jgi:hypothetical protein
MFKFMVTKLVWIILKIRIHYLSLTYLLFTELINVLEQHVYENEVYNIFE